MLGLPHAGTVSSPHMTRGGRGGALLLVSLPVASGSEGAPPCQEHEIGLDGPAPVSLERNASPIELVDALARVMRDKLALPFSPAYKAYVCSDEAVFAEALLRNFGARGCRGDWGIGPSSARLAT